MHHSRLTIRLITSEATKPMTTLQTDRRTDGQPNVLTLERDAHKPTYWTTL